jgi:hypothetical protein
MYSIALAIIAFVNPGATDDIFMITIRKSASVCTDTISTRNEGIILVTIYNQFTMRLGQQLFFGIHFPFLKLRVYGWALYVFTSRAIGSRNVNKKKLKFSKCESDGTLQIS